MSENALRTWEPFVHRPITLWYGHALLLIVLFAGEAAVFYWFVAKRVAPFFPPGLDQISYYLDTYDLIVRARAEGWWLLVREYTHPRHGNGIFTSQGALLGLLFGSNRTAILSLNFVYFVVLQVVMFATVRDRTGRTEFAWLALAFLISSSSIFAGVGGLYDYRIDFSAFCIYGIWACLVMWSRTFANRNRALVVAAVAVMLIWLRYFTVIYIALIVGILLVVFLVAAWRATAGHRRALHLTRARNILASGVLTALFALPVLYLARSKIYSYYVVGHIVSDEKYIRARELGLYTVIDHIRYYPSSLWDHLGPGGRFVIAIIAFVAIASALWLRFPVRAYFRRLHRYRSDILFLALSILIPIAILTINIAKSPVVAGILLAPVILAVALLSEPLWPFGRRGATVMPSGKPRWWGAAAELTPTHTGGQESARGFRLGTAITTLVVAIAIATFAKNGLARQDYWSLEDQARVRHVNEEIGRYALESRIDRPTVSFDRIMEYLNWGTLRLFTFERYGRLVDYEPLFGHGPYGIFATERHVAMELIIRSQIVIITDPVKGREAPYPANAAIRGYWDEIAAWTERNRALLLSTEILDGPIQVYAGPAAIVGAGYITLRAINPTPNSRLMLELTASLKADGDNRVPPVQVVGQSTAPLGAIGRGSARLYSQPLTRWQLGDAGVVSIDMGVDGRHSTDQDGNSTLDIRRLTSFVRDISFVAEGEYEALKPPSEVRSFPRGLADKALEYSGLYEDGWMAEVAFLRLAGPTQTAQFRIFGQARRDMQGTAPTELVVRVEGVEKARERLKPGHFTIVFDLAPTDGPIRVELEANAATALSPADRRPASVQLSSVGWRSDAHSYPSAFRPASDGSDVAEAVGFWADGWAATRARLTLSGGAAGRLAIRGMTPKIEQPFTTKLIVAVDGKPVGMIDIQPGDVVADLPLAASDRPRWITLEFGEGQNLPPPDSRHVGMLVREIAIK